MAAVGCHAQNKAPETGAGAQSVQVGVKLSPELARRVEVMIRGRSSLPIDAVMAIGVPARSDVPGFDQIDVTFTVGGNTSHPLPFLLSTDGKTLAQFNKFDISQDPRDKVSPIGRPPRGGPANAPVLIVGFDDLECPFCAQMNAMLFPGVLARYKDQVRIVYRDLPLEELHPWAMHAAVDANCLAANTTVGYWNYVDYVHAHSADMAGTEKTAAKAYLNLDKLALDEGARQNLNQKDLAACIEKQDTTRLKASVAEAEGEPLSLNQTPVLFINGEKVEGIVSPETLDQIIDSALVAAGRTPPPPPPPAKPAPSATPASAPPAAGSATKPGS